LVFHEVQTDLEAAGYEVFPYVLPTAAVNAPHRRDRVWFVAYSNNTGNQPSGSRDNGNGQAKGSERQHVFSEFNGFSNTGIDTHPNSNGFNGSDCEHEEKSSERGFDALGNIEQMGRDATDTDNERCQRDRTFSFTEKQEQTCTGYRNNLPKHVGKLPNSIPDLYSK
jgi:site-specific DNA-cytosine methylase